jgi:hypothetical protein
MAADPELRRQARSPGVSAGRQMPPEPVSTARLQEQLGLLGGTPVSRPGTSAEMGWLPSMVLTLGSIVVVLALLLASRAIYGTPQARQPQETSSRVDRSPPAQRRPSPAFEALPAAPQAPPRPSSVDAGAGDDSRDRHVNVVPPSRPDDVRSRSSCELINNLSAGRLTR